MMLVISIGPRNGWMNETAIDTKIDPNRTTF